MSPHRRSIGALARESGLTVGALRFYDAAGVLRPARVDPGTAVLGRDPNYTVLRVYVSVRIVVRASGLNVGTMGEMCVHVPGRRRCASRQAVAGLALVGGFCHRRKPSSAAWRIGST